MPDYGARIADTALAERLEEASAVLIVGPRASGKTTTPVRAARSAVRLDRDSEAAASRLGRCAKLPVP